MSEEDAEYKTDEITKQLVSGRKLAAILGFAPSYIAKLKEQGVLNKCFEIQKGKKHPKINVEVAVKEIEASKDPSKEHVRERWEAYRSDEQNTQANKKGNDSASASASTDESGQGGTSDGAGSGVGTQEAGNKPLSFAEQKALQAQVDTEIKVAKLKKEAGELIERDPTYHAIIDSLTDLVTKLMSIPEVYSDRLAAETDANAVRALLESALRNELNEIANKADQSEIDPERLGQFASGIISSVRH